MDPVTVTVDPAVRVRALNELEVRRSQESTYTTPLLRSNDMKPFLRDFYRRVHTADRKQYYRTERERYPEVEVIYRRLCGRTVSFEDFWQRYDYRCDLIRIQNELQHEYEQSGRDPPLLGGVQSDQHGSSGTALSSGTTVENWMDVSHCHSPKTPIPPLSPSTDSLSGSHKENSIPHQASSDRGSSSARVVESATRQKAENEAVTECSSRAICHPIDDGRFHQYSTDKVDDNKVFTKQDIRNRISTTMKEPLFVTDHSTERIKIPVLGNRSIQNNGLPPKETVSLSQSISKGVPVTETSTSPGFKNEGPITHNPTISPGENGPTTAIDSLKSEGIVVLTYRDTGGLDELRKGLIQGMPGKPMLDEIVNNVDSNVELDVVEASNVSAETTTGSSVFKITEGMLSSSQHQRDVYRDDDHVNGQGTTKEKQECEWTGACIIL